jgi:hypothetical protein
MAGSSVGPFRVNEGLDVNVEQSGLFVLGAVEEKFLILVDALDHWGGTEPRTLVL